MRIREGTVADAAAIARVNVDTWRAAYPGLIPDAVLDSLSYEQRQERAERALSDPDSPNFLYVAEDDAGEVFGYAWGGPERTGDPIYRGEVIALYIRVEWHQKGVGRLLIGQVADRLAEQGITSLLIWVLTDNPSRGFYERLGGQLVRESEYEVGGIRLPQRAYGWTSTDALRAHAPKILSASERSQR